MVESEKQLEALQSYDVTKTKPFNFVTFLTNHLRLQKPHIVPDSHCAQAHVKIRKAHPKQAQPRPQHVAAIKTGHARVRAKACRRAGKLVQKSASQMSQRVTAERVATQQNDVDC